QVDDRKTRPKSGAQDDVIEHHESDSSSKRLIIGQIAVIDGTYSRLRYALHQRSERTEILLLELRHALPEEEKRFPRRLDGKVEDIGVEKSVVPADRDHYSRSVRGDVGHLIADVSSCAAVHSEK